MRRSQRLLVVWLAALVALVSWAAPARAVGNLDAAHKAAGYLAGQAPTITDVGAATDTLLALAAAGEPAQASAATALLDVAKNGAADYSKSPEGAAKLSIAVSALGLDAKNFNGVNLVDAVKAGIKPDGSFGAYPSPYASGLGLVALTRADEPVPASMLKYLTGLANTDGGFGYAAGQPSDADNTGLAILGLSTQTDSISAKAALDRAVSWATAAQQPDGSWLPQAGGNAVNSTAVLASALQQAGQDQPQAVQYLVKQQLPDGALPGEGQPNLLATQQAAILLGDASLIDVANPQLANALAPTPAGESASAGPSESAAPSAGAAGEPSTDPSAAPSAEPSGEASAAPESQPTAGAAPSASQGGDAIGWVVLALVLLAAAGAGYYVWNKHRPSPDAEATDGPTDPSTGASASSETAADDGTIVGDDDAVADEFGLPRDKD